jgi:hypothetical protein
MGIQAFPMLADRSMRRELHVVRKAIVSLHAADICDYPEREEREDKLGCARGVIFAFAFQAVLGIGVALCWKFLH